MKKIYFLVIALCVFNGLNAQIINFPDANFKAKLLASSQYNEIAMDVYNTRIKIDVNNNGEIEVNEVLKVYRLNISNPYGGSNPIYISSLAGISNFTNIRILYCEFNLLTSLDLRSLVNLTNFSSHSNPISSLNVEGLSNLKTLFVNQNNLSSLNLNGLISLESLWCENNKLLTLDISGLTNLKTLNCKYNQLSILDLNNLLHLESFSCQNNKLIYLFLKNGRNFTYDISNNPTLRYICTDDNNETKFNILNDNIKFYGYTAILNSYCSFTPGGNFYEIKGNNKLDSNNNGCDVTDVDFPRLKFKVTEGTKTGSLIFNSTGNYSIPVQAGTHSVTPVLENPAYFNVSPTTVNVTFPAQTSPLKQDFCITANGFHPDLEVSILPIGGAIPGFNATYLVVYKNKGNTTQSGSVNLTFNDAVLDFVTANPVTSTQNLNNLSWSFTNLLPLETRIITLTLNVNSPMEIPAVNSGFVLAYKATIISVATDETPIDNTFDFNQTVVNSFDPNDKTCLEGTVISPSLIGEYVHYMIRFENNGTANAQNIVVKDMIDLSKFDISTLIPTNASHSFVTNISAGNKVEFIFENINLPFDDVNNDGYIAFKIKTLPTLKVGDTFANDASIYFDYNFPIVTKLASSTFKTLGTPDFEFANYFTLYPNPAISVLNISSKENIVVKSISIYNTLGQLILVVPNAEKVSKIDVSSLKTGNYFLKINSDQGTSNTRFIKE